MDDAFLEHLRCPLDPRRESRLTREQQSLICGCRATFPVKNGLPILIPTEADLPEGVESVDDLPCVKAARRFV